MDISLSQRPSRSGLLSLSQLANLAIAFSLTLAVSASLLANSSRHEDSKQNAPHAPDISGVWIGRENAITFDAAEPPLQSWAKAKFQSIKPGYGPHASPDSEDPILNCYPPGVPRIMLIPFPIQIVQLPAQVLMIFEYDHFVRQIDMTRQSHPKDLDPTWMGDSIGKWDGDTLVIDTVGLNDKTWLDQVGHPHSSGLHVIERLRRLNHDTLQDTLTVDDPSTYTKPWTGRLTFTLRPGWKIKEYICEDNMPDPPR
jgi:hypothetical protein